MFTERKVNQATNKVELWEREWEYPEGAPAKKIFASRIGEALSAITQDKTIGLQSCS